MTFRLAPIEQGFVSFIRPTDLRCGVAGVGGCRCYRQQNIQSDDLVRFNAPTTSSAPHLASKTDATPRPEG